MIQFILSFIVVSGFVYLTAVSYDEIKHKIIIHNIYGDISDDALKEL